MPTACEIVGIKLTEPTDGISYLPELLGKKQSKHESLYFEFHELGGKQALIKDNWKCIRLNLDDTLKTKVELYNLKTDSLEKHNLATQNPEKVNELIELMNKSRTKNENFLFGFETK